MNFEYVAKHNRALPSIPAVVAFHHVNVESTEYNPELSNLKWEKFDKFSLKGN